MISDKIALKDGIEYISLDDLPFPRGYWWSYSAYDGAYLPLEEVVLKVLEYGDIDEILTLYKIIGVKTVDEIYYKTRDNLYKKDKYLVKILDMISDIVKNNVNN